MSNRHHVIQPRPWLTDEGWRAIEPLINAMPGDGGCVVVMFDARPDVRNYLEAAVVSFTGPERKALRKAIIKAREKRKEAQSQL